MPVRRVNRSFAVKAIAASANPPLAASVQERRATQAGGEALAYQSEPLRISVPSPRRPDARFRETPAETVLRWLLAVAWALKPVRIADVPDVLRLVARDVLSPAHGLPDPASASRSGIAAIAHDLSPETLRQAYTRGLYPNAHAGPIKWRSPPQRSLLFFE